jgi:membrane protein implicated in regulation of membrane protease activity
MDILNKVTDPMIWVIAAVVFSIIEAITLGLTSLWFALAALVALIAALLGAPFFIQVILFAVASVLFLIVTKPLAKDLLKIGGERTNVDALIGERALVTTDIRPFSMGQVKVNGQFWSALAEDGEPLNINETVIIQSIEGVKLIVKKEFPKTKAVETPKE